MLRVAMHHKDHNMFTESKFILASMMLIYLLADTRTAATPSRIVIFVDVNWELYMTLIIDLKFNSLQEHCDISAVARDVKQAQPSGGHIFCH